MSVASQQEALIDALRALHSEEIALVAIIDKARLGGGMEAVVRENRKRLTQVRQGLEERFSDALDARERCHDAIATLRPRADALKSRFEDIRARVRLGQLDAATAKAQAAEMQRQYESVFEEITAEEYRIATLQGFYPGLEAAAASRPKRPRPAAVPPPQPRSLAVPPPQLPRPGVPPPHALGQPATGPRNGPAVPLAATELDADQGLEPPDELEAPDVDEPMFEVSRASYEARPRERRQHPRFPFMVPVKCRNGEQSLLARSSDVSHGGMYIEGHLTLPPGSKLTVLFCAEGFPVEAEAEVRYESSGVGMGVRFTHLPDPDRASLEAELARLKRGA